MGTMDQLTPWTVGNELMHNVCDEMAALEGEIEKDHPEVAMVLKKNRMMLGPLVNTLMEGDPSKGMCPTHRDFQNLTGKKLTDTLQKLIHIAQEKYRRPQDKELTTEQMNDLYGEEAQREEDRLERGSYSIEEER